MVCLARENGGLTILVKIRVYGSRYCRTGLASTVHPLYVRLRARLFLYKVPREFMLI